MKAAYAAPVGMKAYDTLILTVVTNQAFMNRLNAASAVMMERPDAVPLYGAPTLIIVSSTLPSGARDNVAYSNAACIVENIALEAVELGIGTCHIWGAIRALNANPELVKELNLPEGYGRYVDQTGGHNCWCGKYLENLSYISGKALLDYSGWSTTRYSPSGSTWTCGQCNGNHVGVDHIDSKGRSIWAEYRLPGNKPYYWEETRIVGHSMKRNTAIGIGLLTDSQSNCCPTERLGSSW